MKKKGFTLIELLAVIVILAIIALIAVPVIMNIISSARKSAFEDTAYGIIKAGELYYAESLLEPKGMTETATFTFSEGMVDSIDLKVQGSLPKNGTMKVTTDGKVAIAISDGTYCITKGYEDTKIITTKNLENCSLPKSPNPNISSTNSCVTDVTVKCTDDAAAIQAGIKVSVKVNDAETMNFYVISDNGEELTLILEQDLNNEKTAWLSQSDFINNGGTDLSNDGAGCQNAGQCVDNSKGPISALNYLREQTQSWTNVPNMNYTLIDDQSTSKYGPLTVTDTKARMLTYTEVKALGCAGSPNVGPSWLYSNLGASTNGYWLSTTAGNSYQAMILKGDAVYNAINAHTNAAGIRPVITISKMI